VLKALGCPNLGFRLVEGSPQGGVRGAESFRVPPIFEGQLHFGRWLMEGIPERGFLGC